jgi:hypothetical protein
MRIFNTERPSLLLAACAPSVSWLPGSASASVQSAPVAVLAAERAPASQVHQAQIQAELAALSIDGSYGTTGFVGGNGKSAGAAKRMTDNASGVPPRGRPV